MSESSLSGNGRLRAWVVAGVISALVVTILNLSLPEGKARDLLAGGFFSVQTFMWFFFFSGFAEIYVRRKFVARETIELGQGYLPEEPGILLTANDVGPIYKRVAGADDALFLPRIIKRIVLQFQSTSSVEQSSGVLNSSLDLGMHEVDLRYNVLRYTMWVIPTLGFIGTVVGIAAGLSTAAEEFALAGAGIDLAKVTQALGVAFDTTLLALVMSSVIVLLTQLTQAKEENAINQSAQYCLDHLINKLYNPGENR